MTKEEQKIYINVMTELQNEWEENEEKHKKIRYNEKGIRSSQISALVTLLIKKGVLT